PSVALSAVTQPRMPISPPLLPTSTFPLTTIGAMVSVSPRLMSPSVLFQISLPVAASTATVWLSSVLMNTLPSAYAAPRLTVSQHATPCDAAAAMVHWPSSGAFVMEVAGGFGGGPLAGYSPGGEELRWQARATAAVARTKIPTTRARGLVAIQSAQPSGA